MWYRVFGSNEAALDPEEMLQFLHDQGFDATAHFHGDDQGWFHADVVFGAELPIELERYLASEEGIRAQLNTWAAWLDALPPAPYREALMLRMISTKQLITLCPPADDELARHICLALCRYFARQLEGIYQIDGEGLFDVEGGLLVNEGG